MMSNIVTPDHDSHEDRAYSRIMSSNEKVLNKKPHRILKPTVTPMKSKADSAKDNYMRPTESFKLAKEHCMTPNARHTPAKTPRKVSDVKTAVPPVRYGSTSKPPYIANNSRQVQKGFVDSNLSNLTPSHKMVSSDNTNKSNTGNCMQAIQSESNTSERKSKHDTINMASPSIQAPYSSNSPVHASRQQLQYSSQLNISNITANSNFNLSFHMDNFDATNDFVVTTLAKNENFTTNTETLVTMVTPRKQTVNDTTISPVDHVTDTMDSTSSDVRSFLNDLRARGKSSTFDKQNNLIVPGRSSSTHSASDHPTSSSATSTPAKSKNLGTPIRSKLHTPSAGIPASTGTRGPHASPARVVSDSLKDHVKMKLKGPSPHSSPLTHMHTHNKAGTHRQRSSSTPHIRPTASPAAAIITSSSATTDHAKEMKKLQELLFFGGKASVAVAAPTKTAATSSSSVLCSPMSARRAQAVDKKRSPAPSPKKKGLNHAMKNATHVASNAVAAAVTTKSSRTSARTRLLQNHHIQMQASQHHHNQRYRSAPASNGDDDKQYPAQTTRPGKLQLSAQNPDHNHSIMQDGYALKKEVFLSLPADDSAQGADSSSAASFVSRFEEIWTPRASPATVPRPSALGQPSGSNNAPSAGGAGAVQIVPPRLFRANSIGSAHSMVSFDSSYGSLFSAGANVSSKSVLNNAFLDGSSQDDDYDFCGFAIPDSDTEASFAYGSSSSSHHHLLNDARIMDTESSFLQSQRSLNDTQITQNSSNFSILNRGMIVYESDANTEDDDVHISYDDDDDSSSLPFVVTEQLSLESFVEENEVEKGSHHSAPHYASTAQLAPQPASMAVTQTQDSLSYGLPRSVNFSGISAVIDLEMSGIGIMTDMQSASPHLTPRDAGDASASYNGSIKRSESGSGSNNHSFVNSSTSSITREAFLAQDWNQNGPVIFQVKPSNKSFTDNRYHANNTSCDSLSATAAGERICATGSVTSTPVRNASHRSYSLVSLENEHDTSTATLSLNCSNADESLGLDTDAVDPVARQLLLGGSDALKNLSSVLSPISSPFVARNIFTPLSPTQSLSMDAAAGTTSQSAAAFHPAESAGGVAAVAPQQPSSSSSSDFTKYSVNK